VNRVRSGRKQLSAGAPGCRRVACPVCGRATSRAEDARPPARPSCRPR